MKTMEKLQALRGEMRKKNLSAYIVPTEDFHCSEYVGDYFKAREYLSGFTGSAGTLLVMQERALLWTDGRYFLQAEDQLTGSGIELMKSGQPEVPTLPEFLGEHLGKGAVVGFDGRTVTGAFVEELKEKTAAKQVTFYGKRDLVDRIWENRPPMSAEPVWELEISYAGLSREEKLARVRQEMEKAGADALLVTALDETAWLLNLRGGDVKHTPVFLAYMLITKRRALLCAQKSAFSENICNELAKAGVTLLPYESIEDMAASLPTGQNLQQRVDPLLLGHRQQQGVFVFAPVEDLQVVKGEIHKPDFRVIRLQIIPQGIHIMTPVALDDHELFAPQVLKGQDFFPGQGVVDGDSAAQGDPHQLQSGAAPEVEHCLIKDARHQVDVPPQVSQDFPGVLRRVVEAHHLKFQLRADLMNFASW